MDQPHQKSAEGEETQESVPGMELAYLLRRLGAAVGSLETATRARQDNDRDASPHVWGEKDASVRDAVVGRLSSVVDRLNRLLEQQSPPNEARCPPHPDSPPY